MVDEANKIQKKHRTCYNICFSLLGLAAASVIACFIVDMSGFISDSPYIEITVAIMGISVVIATAFAFIANHYVKEYIRYMIEYFEPDSQGLSDKIIKKIIDCEQAGFLYIEEDTVCGCYNCCKIFRMKDRNISRHYTCPHCFSNKIVVENHEFTLDETFLLQMHNFWMEDVVKPYVPNPEVIETIPVCADYYIEIFEDKGVYTYTVVKKCQDEYNYECHVYWTPIYNIAKSFFDTKDKAIESVKQDINSSC